MLEARRACRRSKPRPARTSSCGSGGATVDEPRPNSKVIVTRVRTHVLIYLKCLLFTYHLVQKHYYSYVLRPHSRRQYRNRGTRRGEGQP